MAAVSAGILLYRRGAAGPEVLLVHPGGPFWRGKDEGAWMVPKGGIEAGEESAAAARREFEEELGAMPPGEPRFLCRVRQAGGKWVEAFALEGDFDCAALASNRFTLEYPPRSGLYQDFPEVDEARWFTLDQAAARMLPSQRPILDALAAELAPE
ncbi:MAG: NUDIX domain-containing protein [Alphaproteobacteria bacterium]|nr:NUDIX domain-containing protein [Alphaproteobacteria bacterium]MBV9371830.1 NUDIX domain-containing protein [Alphaproteobacteria bacterium]MBV9900548.1 NUDIX domain-containing protein [Alphaproteobacteria bacterium]